MDERVIMPTWEEIKEELEGRFKIQLYGRTIDGRNILTQWSPIFIDVSWFDSMPKTNNGYWLSIAKNDRSLPMYHTVTHTDSLNMVINELSMYCKKRETKQISLF
jgi:hypothetical protein